MKENTQHENVAVPPPLQAVVRCGVRQKEPRCKCLACKGRTVKYSRAKFVEDMDFFVLQNLVSRKYADEAVRDFDVFHRETEST